MGGWGGGRSRGTTRLCPRKGSARSAAVPLVVSLGWSPRSRGAALGAAAALSPAARSGTERIAEPGLNPFSPRCERGEGAGPPPPPQPPGKAPGPPPPPLGDSHHG